MRVLRTSLYTDIGAPPMTVVACDDAFDGATLEEALAAATEGAEERAYVTHEIFEIEDGSDLAKATMVAMARHDELADHNEAIYFLWMFDTLKMTRPNSVVVNDKRSPLSVESVRRAMDRLTRTTIYRNHTVLTIAEDGTVLQCAVEDGEPVIKEVTR